MIVSQSRRPYTLTAVAATIAAVALFRAGLLGAQEPPTAGNPPPVRLAERTSASPDSPRAFLGAAQPNEHPLMPVLRWAEQGLREMEKIDDYSAIIVKQERINGKLIEPEYMVAKVRHRPFSVYLHFLKPDAKKGQETIYVAGPPGKEGKMWGHAGSGIEKIVGTVEIVPTGPIAMRDNRYPITEIGLLNLVKKLVEVGQQDTKYGECEVKFFQDAKINSAPARASKSTHPVQRNNFRFNVARIFVDDELNVPVRYEAYNWPSKADEPPELTEEYTYLNVKINNHFTDADFDIRNPEYEFHRTQRTAQAERK